MTNWTIVGAGRIGSFLAGINPHTTLVTRGQQISEGEGPIVVCTRNDDLDAVLHATPRSRHHELLFVQNGMLRRWLRDRQLTSCTQALLYFAISKRGDVPVDGGSTLVTGAQALNFVELLHQGGIQAQVVDELSFQQGMAEKYLWNCLFGLLCQAKGCTVGAVVDTHYADYEALSLELGALTEAGLGISLKSGWIERLAAYSRSIPDYEGAVKEWPWRNGWLWQQAQSPLHQYWLEQAKVSLPETPTH